MQICFWSNCCTGEVFCLSTFSQIGVMGYFSVMRIKKTEYYLRTSVLFCAGRWKAGDIPWTLLNGQRHKFRLLNWPKWQYWQETWPSTLHMERCSVTFEMLWVYCMASSCCSRGKHSHTIPVSYLLAGEGVCTNYPTGSSNRIKNLCTNPWVEVNFNIKTSIYI